jgi:hypothetical protein
MIRTARFFTLIMAILVLVVGCEHQRPTFPATQPFKLEGVEPGVHLTDSQAIEVAIAEATAQGRNPSIYRSPKASFRDGTWSVYFGEPPGPPTPALGDRFLVHVYERNNTVSYSPGR